MLVNLVLKILIVELKVMIKPHGYVGVIKTLIVILPLHYLNKIKLLVSKKLNHKLFKDFVVKTLLKINVDHANMNINVEGLTSLGIYFF
jgi:hypothetical protein